MATLRRVVPGVAMLASYERDWFRPDLLAGVTVWAMLVPQAMGYASLAGMPRQESKERDDARDHSPPS